MRRSPLHVELTSEERATLEHWQRCSTMSNGLAQRVRVVLRFAEGQTLRQVARDLGLARNTAKLWLRRFLQRRLEGFADLPRSGRPVSFSPGSGHPLGEVGV
jgi:DNA-directed RNA polymerase specialized sigma24 family protein